MIIFSDNRSPLNFLVDLFISIVVNAVTTVLDRIIAFWLETRVFPLFSGVFFFILAEKIWIIKR